jgi:formylglycine-generating enzyme required for sulfatase activity
MKKFGYAQGHRRKVASMRITPFVLLLFAMLGCGSGTEPAKSPVAAYTTPVAARVKKHMTPAQLALGDPVVNSVSMLLVPIPAGEFQMGSPDSDSNAFRFEKPQHLVKITKPFYLNVYEVTQQQYEKVMGSKPSHFKGPQNPVEQVSWNDAVEFCRKLSEQESVEYRLPTEAEWEYACRAGTTTKYSFGDSESELGDYAWYSENASGTTHPVGGKKPNAWGLYDMHGNVFEWCQDWYGDYHRAATVTDPTGPSNGSYRVYRGGGWGSDSVNCRSAYRDGNSPVIRRDYLGFRVVRDIEPKDD